MIETLFTNARNVVTMKLKRRKKVVKEANPHAPQPHKLDWNKKTAKVVDYKPEPVKEEKKKK